MVSYSAFHRGKLMSTHALSHKEHAHCYPIFPFLQFQSQTDFTKDRTQQLSITSHNIQRISSKPKLSFVNFGEKQKKSLLEKTRRGPCCTHLTRPEQGSLICLKKKVFLNRLGHWSRNLSHSLSTSPSSVGKTVWKK